MKLDRFKSWHLDLMVWVLTVSALIACAVLEDLTLYKAGVMRHIFYRKMEHLAGIYSPEMLALHLSLATVLVIYALLRVFTKRATILQASALIILPGLFVAALNSQTLEELYTYTYILFSLEAGMLAMAAFPLGKDIFQLFSRTSNTKTA
ncbi:hypothetical protein M3P05_18210 [Sansalvadorimonas sp. 2012CJ34-2]|uniref:Uncharacterized protein n=1 Tax=Parendozoicomonas callyspongiae TaxID=2942213 RepID=A0ABT0PKE6_9GAMM|nr:hypothetical protein [Sansalvadorimonas sp. 2012CJ34-2]MCL6271855.1 hypothetical protein [Sansalvadorimonas sp. 2012CJ34-2]